ncbi:hypothetical protein TNCV_586591 [Trichonephila clavipes]|nr:hypothetical protein TNCV_586591 [Trichonephila clavipes]
MCLQKRKGTVDGYEWRCRNQSKDNRHDVARSVRKGTWFSESKLAITIILRLTRYWFGKSMNEFVMNDLKVNKNMTKLIRHVAAILRSQLLENQIPPNCRQKQEGGEQKNAIRLHQDQETQNQETQNSQIDRKISRTAEQPTQRRISARVELVCYVVESTPEFSKVPAHWREHAAATIRGVYALANQIES